jgi:xylose isomerase
MLSIPELADALVQFLFLNGAVDVSRTYQVGVDSKALASPKITVVVASVSRKPLARSGLTRNDRAFDVAYRVKCGDANDEIDRHVCAVESLADKIDIGVTVGDSIVTDVQIQPVFSPEHLTEHGVFTAVIRVVLTQ